MSVCKRCNDRGYTTMTLGMMAVYSMAPGEPPVYECDCTAKIRSLREVCCKNALRPILRPMSFFALLIEGNAKSRQKVLDTVARIGEEWTPPTIDDLTEELLRSWVSELRMKMLIELYQLFGATKSEAILAGKIWKR